MCGIIGEISSEKVDTKKFIQMRDELKHRGPDDAGLYVNGKGNVALGHRRLSIIDLTPAGRQPMSSEDNDVWLTFNGEIYNYKELREELIKRGHTFKSKTDAEVVIHAYQQWGMDSLLKLRGMFAFAIWDEKANKLFLARDRIGIKPLYYYVDNNRFVFSSELKGLIKDKKIARKINPTALKYYFIYRYIPAPYSIWQDIYKLPPAHYLIYEHNQCSIKKYWDLKLKNDTPDENLAARDIQELLEDSIDHHLISDVPVGVLLSGGLDSSMVTAIGSKLKEDLLTYSIGFEPQAYSELQYSRLVANKFKTKSTEKILSFPEIPRLLEKILYFYDEPLGDSSIFPTFLLMETAGKEVKVALSGDGGDEIFAGYNWYSDFSFYKRFEIFAWLFRGFYSVVARISDNWDKEVLKILKYRLKLFSAHGLKRYRAIMAPRFEENEIKELFSSDYYEKASTDNIIENYAASNPRTVKELQLLDMRTFLVDDILVKVDRASMANSLEVRVPFLDHNIIEYVMSLDSKVIFRKRVKKYLLKKMAASLLPPEIIHRRKKGFSAPIDKLGLIEDNIHVLKDSYAVKDGILKPEFIDKLIHSSGAIDRAKLWLLILFELWYREWGAGR